MPLTTVVTALFFFNQTYQMFYATGDNQNSSILLQSEPIKCSMPLATIKTALFFFNPILSNDLHLFLQLKLLYSSSIQTSQMFYATGDGQNSSFLLQSKPIKCSMPLVTVKTPLFFFSPNFPNVLCHWQWSKLLYFSSIQYYQMIYATGDGQNYSFLLQPKPIK